MSEERQMKILVPTGVGAIFLVTVMLTVFLIDNYSAEIISLFMNYTRTLVTSVMR